MAGAKKPSPKPKRVTYNSGGLGTSRPTKVTGPPKPSTVAGMARGGIQGAAMGAKLPARKAGGMSVPSSQRVKMPKPVGGKRVSPPQRKR